MIAADHALRDMATAHALRDMATAHAASVLRLVDLLRASELVCSVGEVPRRTYDDPARR